MLRFIFAAAIAVAPGLSAPTTSTEPCAALRDEIQAQELLAVVPAQLANYCLMTVPVDEKGDLDLIDEIKTYLQWQSTLPYLKDPPPDSRQQPVDLLKGLDDIKSKIAAGGYTSEHAVQFDIYDFISSAHDGHLAFAAEILSNVLIFTRDPETQLVAVSEDGLKLPEIFSYSDVVRAVEGCGYEPSPIVTINGVDAVEYLQDHTKNAIYADDDARYSSSFVNPAGLAIGGQSFGGFARSATYQGATTALGFANGTSRTFENMALVMKDFGGVDSGEAFFNKFCVGQAQETPSPSSTTSSSSAQSTTASQRPPTLTGYPYPVVKHPYDAVSGYFLNGTGYDDVAVLAIPTFLVPPLTPPAINSTLDIGRLLKFQFVVRESIAESKAHGKKRLIVDLRNNAGGEGVIPTDTFKQLFPTLEPSFGQNLLANPAYHELGQIVDKYLEGGDLKETNYAKYYYDRVNLYMADHTIFQQENGSVWKDFGEMFRPVKHHGANFTHNVYPDFNDEQTDGYGGGIFVSGYGINANVTKEQPFASENVVMLEDYACASSCSILHEYLHSSAGIPTIAVSHSPHHRPVTAPTGTKGALQLGLSQLGPWAGFAGALIPNTSTADIAAFNASGLADLAYGLPNVRRRAAVEAGLADSAAISVNGRNAVRRGEEIPLQFVWEEAERKMFYTKEMIVDVNAVWKGAVDAWWGKK
ncbi:hypothetical protein K491DRAFT_654307 [Lophiostoma macrostomum CBS 122681]|uniref:CPAF-like PDZ domain-containing protein n=1 Tax=Lophiostoma macrostomum CBS 122681 TaxID=1314788 RepID=A0A6A6TGL6_9PLEO|nr:hypothetical protein K491DRAFT_654307 [Lophiostoma macrostomum CBS 122681]